MPRLAGLHARICAHPRVADTGLAGLVFVLSVLMPGGHDHGFNGQIDTWAVVLTGLGSGMLVFRRSLPVHAWLATVVLGTVGVLLSGGPPVTIVPSIVALYAVAARRSLPITTGAALLTAAAPLLASLVVDRWIGDLSYGVIGWSGMAAAIGAVARSKRAILAAAEERAVRAEQTREEEAQRRVAEERVRIARDLHDVVAHHISVINVQAGVVRHLLDSDPARARAAITVVREASQVVLTELSAILGLLRTTEDRADTHPAPSLAQSEALVDSMRHAGVRVAWNVTGTPAPLPPLIDLTAYRIIQESLTNVSKHGDGQADVSIEYAPTLVRITVSNRMPEYVPVGAGSGLLIGHGIIGMIERAGSVGGQVQAGASADPEFTVRAELPRELP